jgi:hypothetical protein
MPEFLQSVPVVWIVLGVLFLLWVLLNNKTSRSDGTLVKYVHPYRRMLGYVMKTRNESVVYFDSQVNAEPLLKYMEQTKGKFECDISHLLVGACIHSAHRNPKMNQFIVGKRLYQRKGVWISFSMKRQRLNKEAKLSAVKLPAQSGETFRQLCDRINGKVNYERTDVRTSQDKEFDLLLAMPRPLLSLGVRLFQWLDYHNILPGAFIEQDAFYTTVFIANLGSVGMAPGYHHLFEWGTSPLFLMVGKIEERAVVRNGQIVIEKVLPMRYSYDERIDDGLTARFGIDGVNTVLSDPFTHLGCLSEDGSDAKPLIEAGKTP